MISWQHSCYVYFSNGTKNGTLTNSGWRLGAAEWWRSMLVQGEGCGDAMVDCLNKKNGINKKLSKL